MSKAITPPFDLRAARIERGQSLRDLSRRIDVPEQSLRRLEQGRGVRLYNALKVARAFGIKVSDVLAMSDRKQLAT